MYKKNKNVFFYVLVYKIANKEYLRIYMDNLKIQPIFPTSISQISINNEQSDFGGVSITPQRNNMDRLVDYNIKINGPDIKQPYTEIHHEYRQKNRTTLQFTSGNDDNFMPQASQTEYKDSINGYNLLRGHFSEEEILKAFNIIDINKDNLITEDDLMFVLDYIKEDYTIEQVREMISMLCPDKKQVSYEEFKKLGRGQIIPLAKLNISDNNRRSKYQIMNNVQKCRMISNEPQFLVQCIKKEAVSYQKYQQSKKNIRNKMPTIKLQNSLKNKLLITVPIREIKQFKQRQKLFSDTVVANISDLLQNYHQEYEDKIINIQKISSLLEITIKQAKQLYIKQVDSLLVIMEAIAYSQISIIKKLSYSLEVCNDKNTLSLQQLVHILQIIKGKDQSVQNKIKAIVLSKNMKLDQQLEKNIAFQLVLEYFNKVMGYD